MNINFGKILTLSLGILFFFGYSYNSHAAYYLQLGAFKTKANAQKLYEKAQSKIKQPLAIHQLINKGAELYIVQVGPYNNFKEANLVKHQALKSQMNGIIVGEALKSQTNGTIVGEALKSQTNGTIVGEALKSQTNGTIVEEALKSQTNGTIVGEALKSQTNGTIVGANTNINEIIEHWKHISPVLREPQNEAEYIQLSDLLDQLLDIVGEDESHELMGLIEGVSNVIAMYDDKHYA